VFIKVSGDVTRPGVYGFCESPDLTALLARAGNLPAKSGIVPDIQKDLPCEGIHFHSGADVEVLSNGTEFQVFAGVMSAYNKVTLGIPISLNHETTEGLTAVPGIGPKIAGSIVRSRDTRGGFKALAELVSVPGIGPTLYRKITPYLVL
jgi:competence protein ComEA